MTTLPPFEFRAHCPKCGHKEVGTAYCDGYSLRQYHSPCENLSERAEHLHRHCCRCGYEWLEACMEPHVWNLLTSGSGCLRHLLKTTRGGHEVGARVCPRCNGSLIMERDLGQPPRLFCLACGREAATAPPTTDRPKVTRHRTAAQLAAQRARNRLAREARVASAEPEPA